MASPAPASPLSGASASAHGAPCRHCGTAVPMGSARPDFCCRGCEVVHSLLLEQGLTRFYDLAGDRTAPAEPPRERGLSWLEPLVGSAESSGGDVCSLGLDIQGIHCAACVWLINELFRRREGGAAITVNPALGKVRLSWRRGSFDAAAFITEVERFGYLFGPDRKRSDPAHRSLPIRIGVCAAITINVMLLSTSFYLGLGTADAAIFRLFSRLEVVLSAVVVAVGGSLFFVSAWRALRRGVLHLDLPIAVGIVLAFSASFLQACSGRGDRAYFDTLNVFVTLMLVGRWLQQRVVERNRRFLVEDDGADGLMVRRCDSEGGVARLTLVAAPEVRAGDRLVVAPGDCVPVDALLVDSQGSFSTDWITGEPDVHTVVAGTSVLAGSWNAGRSAVTVLARTSFQDSPLPSLLRAPSPAAAAGVPAHARFFDRYARAYVALVFVVAAGGALLWSIVDPARAIDVTVAVLVVTCPCAVGLAAPLAVELVAGQLRRRGLFIKSPDLLDRLPRVRKLLFDKTGTLTLGRLELAGGDRPRDLPVELRDAAFDMVSRSNHPVSRCLAAALGREGARFDSEAVVVEEAGAGLELRRDGHSYRLGTPAWTGVPAPVDAAIDAPTTVLCRDGLPVAAFATAEQIRPDARRELAALSAAGYGLWLISGDSPARVARFAASIGIPAEHAFGGQRPESKARLVASLDAGDTLYLGDGVNDSLAFDSALVAGTTAIDRPVVPGRADFFLLGEGTEAIRSALVLAKRLRTILRRNLVIAGAYNVLAVTACLLGWMTPLRAALAMPASSLLLLFLTTRALSDRTVAAARAAEAAVPLAQIPIREVA